ncbi:hypothetical protein DFJ58DRAFT_848820 [Suillus subalutaceus]|uniref:uncharacterized protein n=1 Tax=Suillus subalutaceus TaxID=48586 RepID=UPI001B880BA7|nr:uncharacterized protein DFJ58DRAFT_848820 [Suillus subalutaceus]KAG1829216.1 hypothetical protein DFJ58DRAFT_848820 [Suillus subalutaceus]
MPGASWMSREQLAWLSEKMDGFRLSQLQGNVSTYLSEDTILSSARLNYVSYFYRNTSAAGRARVTQFTKTITKLMGSSTERTHGPTAIEHFLHTEYQSGSSVKEDIESHLKSGKYTRQNCMSRLRAEAAKAMTARGQEYMRKMELEAKMECERRAEKAKTELEALCNPDESAHALVPVVGQLLQTIQETTGWYESIYLGGPDPRVAGDVRVFSFHHGKGSTGLRFCEALPDHHTRMVEPFTTFLKGAFATQRHTPNQWSKTTPLSIRTQQLSHSIPMLPPQHTVYFLTEIHQPPQDQSFDNSLGLFGTPLEPFVMSDDTLYEGNAGAGAEPFMMSDDTLYTITPEDNDDSWQTSLPRLPPYPGQLPLLTPPHLRGPIARLESGNVNKTTRPHPRLYAGKSNSIYDKFRDSPPSSPVPSLATQIPSLAEVMPPSPPAALVLPPAASSLPAVPVTPSETPAAGFFTCCYAAAGPRRLHLFLLSLPATLTMSPATPPLPATLTTSPATPALPAMLTTAPSFQGFSDTSACRIFTSFGHTCHQHIWQRPIGLALTKGHESHASQLHEQQKPTFTR